MTARCTHRFLGVECNREAGHHDAHAIGTPREINKFFPRFDCTGSSHGCTRSHR